MERRQFTLGLAALGAGATLPARAQSWPTRPIRMIVPSTPGGLSDGFVRMIGDALLPLWGQAVVMEHKPGAGGIIGTEFVAKSAPDGYTLLLGNIGPLAINGPLYDKIPYHPERDFVHVSLMATYPNVLVVHPSVPANTVAELIALAKQKPGALHFASAGIGQSQHLTGEVFKRATSVDIQHVPYRGTGPALSDLLGGQIAMMFSNVPAAVPLIKSGRLRALGVTSTTRNPALPDVPPISETVAGYDAVAWISVAAPAGTSPEVVSRLNQEIARITQTAENREKYQALGAVPGTQLSPDQVAAFVRAEGTKWTRLIREANIKAE